MTPLEYGDLCGQEWPSVSMIGKSHRCRRLAGHSSEHTCSCGARTDDGLLEVEVEG